MSFPRLRALARLIGSRLPIADRAGSVAIITAIVFPVLLGFAGLAIDVSSWQETAVRAQTAADQAALAAGAASLQSASLEEYTVDAQRVAAANGFTKCVSGSNCGNVTTVTVSSPPQSGSHAGDDGDIEVIVQQQANSFFSGLFLASAPVVGATAVVSTNGGACVIILGRSGTTYLGTGAAALNLNGCDFYNNSTSQAGTTLTGSSSITAEDVYLSGGDSITLQTPITATKVVKNAPFAPDPYAGRSVPSYNPSDCYSGPYYPDYSHSDPGSITAGTVDPTVFCSNVTVEGEATLTLGPGVYIFNNSSLTVSHGGSVTATNATLIFTGSGGFQAIGAASISITAPTSSTGGDTTQTAGMAIWEIQGDSTPSEAANSGGLNITGAVYMPSAPLTLTGAATNTSSCTQLVAVGITLEGSATLKHSCSGVGISDVGAVALIE